MTIKQRESDIQRAILEYLNLTGVFCWRQNQGTVTSEYKGRKRFTRFAGVKGISDVHLSWQIPGHRGEAAG